jgi:uncharacterized protein YecT (DUF1311 family)
VAHAFQAADCQANPGGLWGPGGAGLSANAEVFQHDRLRAEAQMNANLSALSAHLKDSKRLSALSQKQTAFLSTRENICNGYENESAHAFCSLQVTLARAAFLKTRLDELPGVSEKKLQD